MANTGLQNLPEDYLYQKLPTGIIELDERGLLRAVVGGVQDRLEDLRSYAKRFEYFYDAAGLQAHNTVVLVTFDTTYGKTVTRSLNVQDDTPGAEGTDLTAWAADQMGVDISQVSSCVFGEDLLRFVDTNTLQYLAATVGAVLWSTSSQAGTQAQNQQRLMDSYFPRLKVKGTAQSFDVLGRLIGFEDVRMTPLWGRVSPRIPNDFGAPANDKDFAEVPTYFPQQQINSSYDPHVFRDGPYYSWTGTASADPKSSAFYTQTVNGFQPWVQFSVTGSTVVHPDDGNAVTLSGGGPHTKASAVVGQGLLATALAEGEDFNGLQISFATWNNGDSRLVSITDRLSAVKYRTSYYDLAHTMTDQRAIDLFGTNTARQNSDLVANPALDYTDGTASSPFRPWSGGSINSNVQNQDFVYISSGSISTVVPRHQATVQQSQFDTEALQQAGQQALQVMDEVRAATRLPRRSSVGYLNKDAVQYASTDQIFVITFPSGTQSWSGSIANPPGQSYSATAYVEGTNTPLDSVFDPFFNGSIVRFNDGVNLTGVYNLSNGNWTFQTTAGVNYLSGLRLDLYLTPTSSETIRNNPVTPNTVYQPRPEDHSYKDTQYESTDNYPFRRDVIGGGELVEVNSHATPTTADLLTESVARTIAVKDHTGADYTVLGLSSQVSPIRLVAQVNPTDSAFQPGQIPIAYKGGFKSLPNQNLPNIEEVPGYFTDLYLYTGTGFAIYHTGLVQGVLVADAPKFFGRPHRDGLQAWMPFNEHPDEGAVVFDRSHNHSSQSLDGFVLQESFSSRKWSSRRGWYLRMENGASVTSVSPRDITDAYSASFWIRADGTNAATGTNTIFSHGPLSVDLVNNANAAYVYAENQTGTRQLAISVNLTPGTFQQLAFTLNGPFVGAGAATLDSSLVMSTGTLDSNFLGFEDAGDNLAFSAGTNRGYDLSDFRAWSVVKTATDLNSVRNHNPTPTVCTYWPTSIDVAGSLDRYGLKVLDNGFVYPDIMPPAVRMNRLARIHRYDDEGRFHGENRYNETGLGGGMALPPTYLLGQQYFEITATGTTVFSTTTGQVPGFNKAWSAQLPTLGTNQFFSMAGSTATGLTGTNQAVVTSSWPAIMEFTNPIEEVIWVPGFGGGVYEVSLVGVGTNAAALHGIKVARQRSDDELRITSNGTIGPFKNADQPSGAETVISNSGTTVFMLQDGSAFQSNNQNVVPDGTVFGPRGSATVFGLIAGHHYVWVEGTNESQQAVMGLTPLNNGGTPGSQLFFTATTNHVLFTGPAGQVLDLKLIDLAGNAFSNNTPPVYMYLNQRTTDNVTNAWTNWTDNVDPKLFGNRQVPSVAALNSNDVLEFENTSTLGIGRYRLTVVSGNIGQVDADFNGFNVTIAIDTVSINTTLAANASGADFSATDVIEFDLDVPVNPTWLMTVQWFNAVADTSRGTARQLVIRSYKLEQIKTEVYSVTINPSGLAPLVTKVSVDSYDPTLPGGWLAIMNSYGTVAKVVHESQIYDRNDTVSAKVPMSSVLTGNTIAKREDHYVTSGTNVVLTDASHPAMPVFSGIIVR